MLAAQVCLGPFHGESELSHSRINWQMFSDFSNHKESILLYIAALGSVVPKRVLESDPIESVKLRIQTCKGFLAWNDDSVVSDYGIKDGDVLHLEMRVGDLQVINVRTYTGEELTLSAQSFKNILYTQQHSGKKRESVEGEIVEDQELFIGDGELGDQKLINEEAVVHFIVSKYANVQTKHVENSLELSIICPNAKKRKRGEFNGEKRCKKEAEVAVAKEPVDPIKSDSTLLEPIISSPLVELSEAVEDIIRQTSAGLQNGSAPIRASEGTGGAYFMKDCSGSKIVSVFKPVDEEPNAVNNPHGLIAASSSNGEGLKKGTKVGQGALREVAAYILDHPKDRSAGKEMKGFAGVPPTSMVKCFHPGFNFQEECKAKIGSLQKFVANKGSCEDLGPGAFPISEVHKISVFDIRMANADRHAGNILISKDEEDGHTVLVPIDHGYCLPESFEDCTFEWLYWPQARQPYSSETLEYINTLDAEEDISILKLHGWDLSQECARTLRVSTMLLKKAVARGLTPFAIGSIMCRETLNRPSMLEEILKEAENSLASESAEAAFLDTVSQIMDQRLA